MMDSYRIVKREDKTWWAIQGDNAFESVLDGYPEYEKVYLQHVKTPGTCIQAGGYCGIFPYYLSKIFQTVYTFEPDHSNFYCLSTNLIGRDNVIKIQGGLGQYSGDWATVQRNHNANRGMNTIRGGIGQVPIFCIDKLNLDACDLIALDTEGYEANILYGARNTILKYHPLISIEDDNIYTKEFLELNEYEKVEEVYRDSVYVYRG